jgi:hypothetical protein
MSCVKGTRNTFEISGQKFFFFMRYAAKRPRAFARGEIMKL